MKKVLKFTLALILMLATLATSIVWVEANDYQAGDVILDESMIDSSAEISANFKDRAGSTTLGWNEDTGRLAVKASKQGAIEIGSFAPAKDDAFTLSADIYLKGSAGGSDPNCRVGIGVYSDCGTNTTTGWTNGFYLQFMADNSWGDSSDCKRYFECTATSTSTVGYCGTNKAGDIIGQGNEIKARCVSLMIVVDPASEAPIEAYVDGQLVAKISGEITDAMAVGKCFFFVRNSEFEVDNLKIVAGKSSYDSEQSKYEDGAVIMDENIISALAGDDGNTNAIFGTNSDMKWKDGELVFTPSGNVRRQLINFPKSIESYTVSVDFKIVGITNTSATKLVHVGINELPAWANGILLQFSVKGESTAANGTEAHSYFSHLDSSGAKGTSHGKKENYNSQSYA